MAEEPEVLREQIRETQESLASKLSTLEDKVVSTVTNTTETVSETVENVKETVAETIESVKRTFDLEYQVRQHPWLMMAGSCAAGFLAGRLLPGAAHTAERFVSHVSEASAPPRYSSAETPRPNGSARTEENGWLAGLARQFGGELEQVKGLAIGAVLGLVRDWATQNLPENLAPRVEEVFDNVTTKLGGARIEKPVLSSLQSIYDTRKEASRA